MIVIDVPGGRVQRLEASDERLFRDHLMRLDPEGRRDRFNGVTGDAFVERYARECFAGGASVFGVMMGADVVGTTEVHWGPPGAPADVAFSVEPRLRRKGLGTALFQAVIREAERRDASLLKITCSAGNVAMRALARKFGATFTVDHGEAEGLIRLDDVVAPPLAWQGPTGDWSLSPTAWPLAR